MFYIFESAITIFWICDILNMPFMQMFDTTYPINGLAWFLIWMFLPEVENVSKKGNSEKEDKEE